MIYAEEGGLIYNNRGEEVYDGFQEGDLLIRESMPYDHNGRHATGHAEYGGGKWWNTYE